MKSRKKIRYFFESIPLYLFYGLFKILPVDAASGLGGWIGKTVGPRLGASKKALRNVCMAFPNTTEKEQKEIITGMWENLGRVFAEYAHLKKISSERVEIVGFEDNLKAYTGGDTPAIFFSGHIGNWEVIAPSLFLQHQLDGLLIYRPPNNPIADKLLRQARDVGNRENYVTKSGEGIRNLMKYMKTNRIVGILIDQKFNRGLPIPFFEHNAMTSTVFVDLALKFNAPLIPIRLERVKGANFKLTAEPAMDIKGKSVEDILKETHIILENWIKERPEQWLWLHRRWGKFEEMGTN